MREFALKIVEGFPINAKLSNSSVGGAEFEIFASPVRYRGLLRFWVEPFAMRTPAFP